MILLYGDGKAETRRLTVGTDAKAKEDRVMHPDKPGKTGNF